MRLNPNEDEITQMRVMKLLYYIQAASLAVEGKRLFDLLIIFWWALSFALLSDSMVYSKLS